jgi:hypothetical protein
MWPENAQSGCPKVFHNLSRKLCPKYPVLVKIQNIVSAMPECPPKIRPSICKRTRPPQWHYDVLQGLDYLQAANAVKDTRLGAAIELVKKRYTNDGRWLCRMCTEVNTTLRGGRRSAEPLEHSPSVEGAGLVGQRGNRCRSRTRCPTAIDPRLLGIG